MTDRFALALAGIGAVLIGVFGRSTAEASVRRGGAALGLPIDSLREIHPQALREGVYSSLRLQQLAQAAGIEWGVAPNLIGAIARVESNFDARAKGAAGEIGMFQIMPSTGKTLLSREGFPETPLELLNDPPLSMWLAARLLSELKGELGVTPNAASPPEDWALIIQAYNLGSPKVKQGVRNGAYLERVVRAWTNPQARLWPEGDVYALT